MARYEFVKGLPVITMAEGKQVGKIDDLVVDPERKAVRWLRIRSGGMGMLGGERLWVSADAVHGVGDDAITINTKVLSIGEDVLVVAADSAKRLQGAADLVNLPVA